MLSTLTVLESTRYTRHKMDCLDDDQEPEELDGQHEGEDSEPQGEDSDPDELYTGAFCIRWAVARGTLGDLHTALATVRSHTSCASACSYANYGETDVLAMAAMQNDAGKVRLLIDNGADLFNQNWSELSEQVGSTHSHVFQMIQEALHGGGGGGDMY